MVDLHLNELNVAQLDRTSPGAALLLRAAGPATAGRWLLLDKLEVSERLQAGGVPVPPFGRLDAGAGRRRRGS